MLREIHSLRNTWKIVHNVEKWEKTFCRCLQEEQLLLGAFSHIWHIFRKTRNFCFSEIQPILTPYPDFFLFIKSTNTKLHAFLSIWAYFVVSHRIYLLSSGGIWSVKIECFHIDESHDAFQYILYVILKFVDFDPLNTIFTFFVCKILYQISENKKYVES